MMRRDVTESQGRHRWWERHPRWAILLINCVILLLVLAGTEIFLRLYLPYNPGYYMAFEQRPGLYRFPYGVIRHNSLGFPDEEFDLASARPRVGYFGDSVTRGVGVGSGYRISDLLEAAYPAYEHWTFGTVREGVDEKGAETIIELTRTYDLDIVVYLLNLNDILPSQRFTESGEAPWLARILKELVWLDHLRGRSYLYSALRSQIPIFLASRGYGYQGWKAAEFFPGENARAIRETAERVSLLAEELKRRDVAFVVVLLPYEMQISAEAATKYWELGIRWEDGFLDGLPQQRLVEHFSALVRAFDAREAFLNDGSLGPSQENELGQYFVYDRGDKLDWNHPNREGHRLIAQWLAEQAFLDAPRGDQDPGPPREAM